VTGRSRWFANSKDFPGMLNEDLKVRDYLKKRSRTLRWVAC
jgi:ribosomal protein S3